MERSHFFDMKIVCQTCLVRNAIQGSQLPQFTFNRKYNNFLGKLHPTSLRFRENTLIPESLT